MIKKMLRIGPYMGIEMIAIARGECILRIVVGYFASTLKSTLVSRSCLRKKKETHKIDVKARIED